MYQFIKYVFQNAYKFYKLYKFQNFFFYYPTKKSTFKKWSETGNVGENSMNDQIHPVIIDSKCCFSHMLPDRFLFIRWMYTACDFCIQHREEMTCKRKERKVKESKGNLCNRRWIQQSIPSFKLFFSSVIKFTMIIQEQCPDSRRVSLNGYVARPCATTQWPSA